MKFYNNTFDFQTFGDENFSERLETLRYKPGIQTIAIHDLSSIIPSHMNHILKHLDETHENFTLINTNADIHNNATALMILTFKTNGPKQ